MKKKRLRKRIIHGVKWFGEAYGTAIIVSKSLRISKICLYGNKGTKRSTSRRGEIATRIFRSCQGDCKLENEIKEQLLRRYEHIFFLLEKI